MKPNMYTRLIEAYKDKYFQDLFSPTKIASFSNTPVHLIESGSDKLDAWFPIQEKWMQISFDRLHFYREITKEKFEKIKSLYNKGLEDRINKEHNKEIISENKKQKSSNYWKNTAEMHKIMHKAGGK